MTSIQFKPHGNVTMPSFNFYPEETSLNWFDKSIYNNAMLVTVGLVNLKYLCKSIAHVC